MDIKNRTLFFGDNLDILNKIIPDNFFKLIYLDPPFNSNRNYNVLFKEGNIDSSAQIHAFEDTWEWTGDTIKLFNELINHENPQIAILTSSLSEFIGQNSMMAYLVNMTARLIPLKRVLKIDGSIYLHCDPTSSHYLKIILDVIFGRENFRNEIIWCYTGASSPGQKQFPRKHDTILWYSKSNNWTFNESEVRVPYDESTIKRAMTTPTSIFHGKRVKRTLHNGKIVEDYWNIPVLGSTAKERLGYPTQKPEALLDRIISASSNEGDWVLDPFCGCGTTVAVAEKLKRNWIGIDISMLAINVIAKRMSDHYPKIDITLDGIPKDIQAAKKLADKDKYSFQDWAISLIGARPPSGETKKGADRGIDGLILFYEKVDFKSPNPKLRKIVVQVKGGTTGRGDVAKLKGDIERESSPMGILITLNDPTTEMIREARLSGEYMYSDNLSFPKIQLMSINDYFLNKLPKLPNDTVDPFKKAEIKENTDQESLF